MSLVDAKIWDCTLKLSSTERLKIEVFEACDLVVCLLPGFTADPPLQHGLSAWTALWEYQPQLPSSITRRNIYTHIRIMYGVQCTDHVRTAFEAFWIFECRLHRVHVAFNVWHSMCGIQCIIWGRESIYMTQQLKKTALRLLISNIAMTWFPN